MAASRDDVDGDGGGASTAAPDDQRRRRGGETASASSATTTTAAAATTTAAATPASTAPGSTSGKLRKRQQQQQQLGGGGGREDSSSKKGGDGAVGIATSDDRAAKSNTDAATIRRRFVEVNRRMAADQRRERERKALIGRHHGAALSATLRGSARRVLVLAGLVVAAVAAAAGYLYVVRSEQRRQRPQQQQQGGGGVRQRRTDEQQHRQETSPGNGDGDGNREDEDDLPPVLRHVVMLYPRAFVASEEVVREPTLQDLGIRRRLPPLFEGSRYAVATPRNALQRKALRAFHDRRVFLTNNSGNSVAGSSRWIRRPLELLRSLLVSLFAAASSSSSDSSSTTKTKNDYRRRRRRNDDAAYLYGWERHDFESQLLLYSSRQKNRRVVESENNNENSNDNNSTSTLSTTMERACGTGFTAVYDRGNTDTEHRHPSPQLLLQDDLIVWCLLSNAVHDGYAHWQIEPPSLATKAAGGGGGHRRRPRSAGNGGDDDKSGDSVRVQQKQRRQLLRQRGLLLLQPGYKGLAVQYYGQERILSSSVLLLPMQLQHHRQSSSPLTGKSLAQETLDWLVWRGRLQRLVGIDDEAAFSEYKRAFEEYLYRRIAAESTTNSTGNWILLHAVCRVGDDGEAPEERKATLADLDSKYRRVATTGCHGGTSADNVLRAGNAGSVESYFHDDDDSCDCVIFHPLLKPVKIRRQIDDDDA